MVEEELVDAGLAEERLAEDGPESACAASAGAPAEDFLLEAAASDVGTSADWVISGFARALSLPAVATLGATMAPGLSAGMPGAMPVGMAVDDWASWLGFEVKFAVRDCAFEVAS